MFRIRYPFRQEFWLLRRFRLILLTIWSWVERVDMGWGCGGVHWSCWIGALERGEKGSTGFLLTGCRGAGVECSCWIGTRGVDRLHSQLHCTRCEQSETKGVLTGRFSPCSGIKFPALFNWDIFVGENKCLDQGTILLYRREDEGENIPFSAPGAT